MSKPLVSIIMPIYKVADCIASSLESALNQSYPNIEYVLVNDCTPDESMDVVTRLISQDQNKFKKINIVNLEKNGGLSNARNQGLRAAQGDFVFFMDSDDLISSNCIEVHLNAIERYSADFSDGNVAIVGVNHNIFKPYETEMVIDTGIPESYFTTLHVCGWNKLIRKSFLEENMIFFKKDMLYEDNLWCYQLCKIAKKYVTIPQTTYFYLIRNGSITTQNSNRNHAQKQFSSFLLLLNLITEEFSTPYNNQLYKLQQRWINLFLIKIKTRLFNAPLNKKEKIVIYSQLMKYGKDLPLFLKLYQQLPYSCFKLIFSFPNYIFRKLRH